MVKKELDHVALSENPRASLMSWLRFRDHIIKAIDNYPRKVTFHPSSLRPSTYASRVRDAIRGAIAFGYDCGPHTTEALLTWYTQVSVRHTKTSVIIGPRDAIEEVPLGGVQAVVLVEDKTSHYPISEVERDAIVTLVGCGRLPSGTTLDFVWPGWVSENPNVIATVRDGKTILI